MGRPSRRNWTERTVLPVGGETVAVRVGQPVTWTWGNGTLVTFCETTLTSSPAIVSVVSVTSFAVVTSWMTCSGSTVARRMYVPSGTPTRLIGCPESVWSYSSPQPADQPRGRVGSAQFESGMNVWCGGFG